MNKPKKSDREVLLDANLDFVMNSPDDVFDAYLSESGEDGGALASRTATAMSAAIAKHKEAKQAAATASGKAAAEAGRDWLKELTVPQLRSIKESLGVPRQVLTAFRERRVVSVPRRFLARLAEAIGTTRDELMDLLARPVELGVVNPHKADEKPEEKTLVTFEQLLIDAGVPPERRAELMQDGD